MTKLQSIQIGRAVACVLVVIYHLLALSKDYAGGAFYQPGVSGFKAGVDIFFVISGVVMVITTFTRFETKGTATRFFIHRVSRIYPPYWGLAAPLTLYWLRNPGGVNAEHGGVDILASWTLAPSDKLPIVPVAWTLTFELMFYLVFGLFLAFLARRHLSLALLAWGGVILLAQPFAHLLTSIPLASFLTSPFVLEFVGGCLIGLAIVHNKVRFSAGALAAGCAIFASEFIMLQVAQAPDTLDPRLRVGLYAAPALLTVYGLIGLERSGAWTNFPRWMVKLGDASYSLYLIHILVFHALYRIAFTKIFGGSGAAFLPLAFMTSIVGGYIYFRLFEQPVSTFVRVRLERLAGVHGGRAATPAPSSPSFGATRPQE
ncbi:acyltransferase [uncultured Sphingomonas sp.]|uniref:acyltransferase family protein n=1 Tax=uncultured Sphingomonas sp. TaxID=158754 RepID=UPI0025857C72|nr:acyltransferase [uncultured Sphingomonas sp.]